MTRRLRTPARYLVLLVVSAATVYPVFWLGMTALKSQPEYGADPFGLPLAPTLGNFALVLSSGELIQYFLNSVVVTSVSVVLVLALAVPAGYALARLPVPAAGGWLLLFLISQMIPTPILAIPTLVVLRAAGLLGGLVPLIPAYLALTIGASIFLMWGFFRSLPQELLDAARLDGASEIQCLLLVMLPLARSGVFLIAVMNFIEVWNEFFLALVLIQSQSSDTIPLGLVQFSDRFTTDWPALAAALLLSAIPTMILYALFQGRIVDSLGRGLSYR
jgi:raffinose/stachyose/melibiose transport system permease protein